MAKLMLSLCALLCLLLALTSVGEAKPAKPSTTGCCSQYFQHPLPVEKIVSYTVDRPGRCRLDAVKFTMVSGKVFCADPAEKWVQDAMKTFKNGKSAA